MIVAFTDKEAKELRRLLREIRDAGRIPISGGYQYVHNPDGEIAEALLKKLKRPKAQMATRQEKE